LERKAIEYERLKRGWSKDLTDQQREEIMVDFDTKYIDGYDDEEEKFDGGYDDEPLVEVEDEFGRTRMVKASRIRRPLTPEEKLRPYSPFLKQRPTFRTNVIYGDYMPTFQVDEDKAREINEREDKGAALHTLCSKTYSPSGRCTLRSERRSKKSRSRTLYVLGR